MKAMPDEDRGAEMQEKKGLILETFSDITPLRKSPLHFLWCRRCTVTVWEHG